jgi:hypothetical protein
MVVQLPQGAVGREMQHRGPQQGQAGCRGFLHQRAAVRCEGDENIRHPRQMRDRAFILPPLEILLRAVAFMRPHHRRERRELRPAAEQLGRAAQSEQAGIAADIAVMVRVPHQAGGQRRADCGFQPVMAGEIDALIPRPQQRAIALRSGIAGAHEEHRVAFPAGPRDRLIVQSGPAHRPGIVFQQRIRAIGKPYIVGGQILAEIRHPSVHSQFQHPIQHVLAEPRRGGR